MEGVIVLYSELVSVPTPWYLILVIVIGISGALATLSVYLCNEELNSLVPLFFAIIFSLGVYFSIEYQINNKQLVQYVAIEDSVSMNDFIERYEILEIKGDMLKVVEKERG